MIIYDEQNKTTSVSSNTFRFLVFVKKNDCLIVIEINITSLETCLVPPMLFLFIFAIHIFILEQDYDSYVEEDANRGKSQKNTYHESSLFLLCI